MKYAQYGGLMLKRAYCKKCKSTAIVIGGILQCCDSPIEEDTKGIKVMCETNHPRRKPSIAEQKKLLDAQGNKCLYCNREFGTLYSRNGKLRILKVHYDHIVPYSYAKSNKQNFVASCNVCNSLKSNLMFETVQDCIHHLEYQRKRKNIIYVDEIK